MISLCSAATEEFVTGTGSRGAVACESRVCSQIGIEILERGVSLGGLVPSFFFVSGAVLIM